jgi:hypothetical protein
MTKSIFEGLRSTRRGSRRRRITVAAWCVAALLPALIASSSTAADIREDKERAAKRACLSGDYATGVSLLTDLYLDTNDPNYLFNKGRCYEQCNRCEEAIISFREYLRKMKDAGKTSDGRTEQHIADCEELLSKARAQPAPSVGYAAAPQPPAYPVPPSAQPATGPAYVAQPSPAPVFPGQPYPVEAAGSAQAALAAGPPAPTPGRGLRIAGAVTFGVGVAAVGAGVGFALAANKLADDLERSPSSYERSKESTRSTYATLSMVGYAAGGVCVAGGAVLYFLGWRQGSSSATVQPMVSARSAGALVQVAF